MPLGEERRKYIRIFLPGGKVRFLSGQYLALVGRMVDVSVGGVSFISEMKLSIDESVNLEIVIPDGVKFKCLAKIVRIESKANQIICAASFVNLGESEQKKLGEFIMKMRSIQDKLLKKNL